MVFYAGEFLALTGARLNGKELVVAGLATHFVPSEVSLNFITYCTLWRNGSLIFHVRVD